MGSLPRMRSWIRSLSALSLLLGASVCALADGDSAARFASNQFTVAYLVGGSALPLLRDGDKGKEYALRIVDAGVVSALAAGLIKDASHSGFPSRHTAPAFAVAAIQSEIHPNEAALWYGGATFIGWSRISLGAHSLTEVVGGAALGYGVAKLELGSKNGLLLAPILGEKGFSGLALTARF